MRKQRKCEVSTCPRSFTPGVSGANGRCSRCERRRNRGQPEVTAEEAARAEARAAGALPARSKRVVGYIYPELDDALREAIKSGRYSSESEAINRALAALIGTPGLE